MLYENTVSKPVKPVTVGTDSVGRRWYGTRRSTGFFFWERFMALDRFNPLRRIGLATDQVSVLSELGHCQTGLLLLSLSYLSYTMRPIAPRPPRPIVSPSSSTSSGSIGSVHRERERSPHTPLPLMAPAPAPGSVYPIPRTPMSDARRYRSLFSRCRVAPPTPPLPSPPPSDDEPSVETYNQAADLVGDSDESYIVEHVPISAPEAYYSDSSYGSKYESSSTDSAPSSHHSSGSSSGSVSLGYGFASSGSASDSASDDDLVNRYFAEIFPQP
ncbi:hypothetical protein PIB30_021131 [Stylosanthes scabra]|uniref:Uncharacterized protein n=1 Tax=Stylosanthes scabra TaxID=79078 RepID=A0ABU6Q9A1_9FABA|nr:hypothetical protein [Stylosanthes scabra]